MAEALCSPFLFLLSSGFPLHRQMLQAELPFCFKIFLLLVDLKARALNCHGHTVYISEFLLCGGLIGAVLASKIDDKVFNKIFVGVMIFSVLLIVLDPFKSRGAERLGFKHQLTGVFLFSLSEFMVGLCRQELVL